MMKLHTLLLTAIAAALFALPTMTASADITFSNNDAFDLGGPGVSVEFTDPETGLPVTITIVDIIGQDGSSALAGNNHFGNVNLDGEFSINSSAFGGEINDFNDLEAFIFSFDTGVTFQGITFGDIAPGGSATLQIGAGTPFILNESNAGVIADTIVDADTPIRLGVNSLDFDITAINLDVIAPPSVVPEPSSLAVLGLLGSLATIRRRR